MAVCGMIYQYNLEQPEGGTQLVPSYHKMNSNARVSVHHRREDSFRGRYSGRPLECAGCVNRTPH
ncbi:hypothetical protein BVC80_59g24 [Macleaya cordata]|uniref:Uncharacterized protein n=1 Tax=Macleaya cordata TaxID=56857 RepID=A0A200QJH3_MACCD|nr:hypothetical protein BVC80_59g24 [Macleaya cordata]